MSSIHRFKGRLFLIPVLFILIIGIMIWGEVQAKNSRVGDFNENGLVDSDDLFDFAYYFGLQWGDPLYESEGHRADFDGSGRIDEMDLFQFSIRWHREIE